MNTLQTKRTLNVYGLGNALVDSIVDVTDTQLQQYQIDKGLMTLIDEKAASDLTALLQGLSYTRACGGSGANTLIALSELGGRGFYNCCVANDEAGVFYLDALKRANLQTQLDEATLPAGTTGQCFAFITPDIQRSMQTYLGESANLSSADLSLDMIPKAQYLYIEGYLAAQPLATEAAIQAYQTAKQHGTQIAITLSDPNMVTYCKENLLAMMGDGVDLLFCNEEEAALFTQTDDLESTASALQRYAKAFVITLGAKGALIYQNDVMQIVPGYAVKAIDSLGAGDMFAGTFLYAITQNYTFKQAASMANYAASRIVAKVGARLDSSEIKALLSGFSTAIEAI